VELYLHSPNTPSWHDAQLKAQEQYYLYIYLYSFDRWMDGRQIQFGHGNYEKFSTCPYRESNPGRPDSGPVTTLTELLRLLTNVYTGKKSTLNISKVERFIYTETQEIQIMGTEGIVKPRHI
jgi:hypothetical protein